MEIGDVIVCIYNNNIYWPSLKISLTVGKAYTILNNVLQKQGDNLVTLYAVIDDNNERRSYNEIYFISLNEYREKQLNKLFNERL